MYKKGLMNIGQKISSFLVGLICIVLGLLVFINKFYDISFLPAFLFNDLFLKIFLIFGGLFLLYDSLRIGHGLLRVVSFLAGVLVFLVGLVPLLIHFKLLNFLPYFATLTVSSDIIRGILIFFGIYLIVDSFVMSSREEE
jgi:hypothetical protein